MHESFIRQYSIEVIGTHLIAVHAHELFIRQYSIEVIGTHLIAVHAHELFIRQYSIEVIGTHLIALHAQELFCMCRKVRNAGILKNTYNVQYVLLRLYWRGFKSSNPQIISISIKNIAIFKASLKQCLSDFVPSFL